MKIRIAQIKVIPKKGDLESNQRILFKILDKIARHKPDVVITPENYLDGYVVTESHIHRKNLAKFAINPKTSSYTAEISKWSAKHRSWFIYACTRKASQGCYNSALIINRKGKLIGIYDKVHCQAQDKKFIAGKSLPVFKSDFGLFGVMICADRRWPETTRTLALKGAKVIFNPTLGMCDERNRRMMQTRSYESEVFIAFTHGAQALVTGPKGKIYSDTESKKASFAITDIDLSDVPKIRSHLRDRRPDVYIK
jgi:beta-ureidopropionase